jgi:hypothetical protein
MFVKTMNFACGCGNWVSAGALLHVPGLVDHQHRSVGVVTLTNAVNSST